MTDETPAATRAKERLAQQFAESAVLSELVVDIYRSLPGGAARFAQMRGSIETRLTTQGYDEVPGYGEHARRVLEAMGAKINAL